MASGDDGCELFTAQGERDDRAESAVTEHRDPVGVVQMYLVEDFECGRRGFNKNCGLVGDRIRQWEQVRIGEAQVFCERAVTSENSEHGARRAMTAHPVDAWVASPAGRVDLADHPTV